MNSTARIIRSACLLALAVAVSACGSEPPATVVRARAVEVTSVSAQSYAKRPQFTGVAIPYRQARAGFEVAGRITNLRDVGTMTEITIRPNRTGSVEAEGSIIAQIDDTTYRQRLEASQLRLRTAMAGIDALKVELSDLIPARIARAKSQEQAAIKQAESAMAALDAAASNERLALANLKRTQRLFQTKTVSKSELDRQLNAHDAARSQVTQARAGHDAALESATSARATVEEAEAGERLKKEELARARAQARELELAVRQARTDLERCTLRAPFEGRITNVHVSHGDWVQPGSPVITLTLIDPIKVSVSVSAEQERSIPPGEHAFVYPTDLNEFGKTDRLVGTVFEKGSVADSATRTFQIDVMVRNARRRVGSTKDLAGTTPVSFRQILPALQEHAGEKGPLFASEDSIVSTRDGEYVYRIPGAKFGIARPSGMFSGRLKLEPVAVTSHRKEPSDFFQVLNWRFCRVTPSAHANPLSNGDLVLSVKGLNPRQIAKGGVRLDRFEWAIRPGDLVPVTFGETSIEGGVQVPLAAIVARGDERFVYVVRDDKAHRVAVLVTGGESGDVLVRSEELVEGDRVVVRGAHYCHDGAVVNVVRNHTSTRTNR